MSEKEKESEPAIDCGEEDVTNSQLEAQAPIAEPSSQESGNSGGSVAGHVVASSEMHAGPLPSPRMLREYGDIHPGLVERIIVMAEHEQKHRHASEGESQKQALLYLKARTRESSIGQIFAFLLATFAIIGGLLLLAFDKPVGGIATIIGTLATLLGVFGTNRYFQSRDRQSEKEEAEDEQG